MKFLKYFLLFVLLMVGVMLLMGILGPEMKIKSSTQISNPPEDVYAALLDETIMKDWMSSFKRMELMEGEKHTVGARYKLIFEENEEVMEMYETVTAIEENKLYAFDFSNDVMTGNVTMSLVPVDGGTELNVLTTFRGRGVMFRALLPFFKGSMETNMENDYSKLKAIIESDN